MTKVIFEVATIAACIKNAERIAPDRGAAFDKAAGIVIEVDPEYSQVIVRVTNLDVYYMEWVDPVSVDGEPAIWRLPSRTLAGLLGSLPIASGRTVEFENEGRVVHIRCGKLRSKFSTIDPEGYPEWTAFVEDDLVDVPDLGAKIQMVEWAADKKNVALGLHFTGKKAIGADRVRMATCDLDLPGMTEPITVPPGMLGGIVRPTGDTKIQVTEHQLWIMPDPATQIRTIIISEAFPPMTRVMATEYTNSIKFKKTELIDMINRVRKVIDIDRDPNLTLFVGRSEMSAMMTEEGGLIGDTIDAEGADHPRIKFLFSPEGIADCIANAPTENLTFWYQAEDPYSICSITDRASSYKAFISPRRPMKQG